MLRRLLARWEALPPRHEIAVATPIAFLLLFLIHASPLFPLLDWKRALTYAIMECVPVALVLTFATQTELARREHWGSTGGDASDDATGDEPPRDDA